MNKLSKSKWMRWIATGCIATTTLTGCQPVDRFRAWRDSSEASYYQNFVTQIEYPDVRTNPQPQATQTIDPLMLENPSDLPTFDLTLQDAIRIALENSDVLRNIGGTVVTAPQGTPTQIDPALTEVNPLNGTQAALAAFDVTVNSQLFWQKNDRPVNVRLQPGLQALFAPALRQTLANYQNNITKRSAQGATYTLRSNVIYDRNNNPTRRYPSDFQGFLEAEWRQPMMQGAGTTFNRIAGPNSAIGQYNGVLIARINTDISLADFELGVIRTINDVETAYWELYYAYRNLEAIISGRESALKSWRQISQRFKVGLDSKADEAQALSNYYLFQSQLNDALAGTQGLYAAEQRLRYMIAFTATDGRLIRPSDEPLQAQVMFDWQESLADAIGRRPEVRRQEWTIKRRELELIAARLNRRPQFDALSTYRYRGLGDHLIGENNPMDSTDNFFSSLGTGDYQEWQSGFELAYPVGLRQASAAVRHAQLSLARDMAVLEEQQLRISHDLSNAARQITRSYEQILINYNRVEADIARVKVLENRWLGGLENIAFLLQAQQQLATSTSALFRALTDYNLAVRDFHREKGSLLTYNQINLSEESLNGSMLSGAYERGRYLTPRDVPEEVTAPRPVSGGRFDPSSVGIPGMGLPMEMIVPEGASPPLPEAPLDLETIIPPG